MAARLNRNHTESVLARIQVSNLVTRLQKHALRQLKSPHINQETGEYDSISMTDSEITAAKFLIERTLARAEAPKRLDVHLSWADLIEP
jgi:hypothetical protein